MKPLELGVAYYVGTKMIALTKLVTSVTWRGDIVESARHCDITLRNTINGSTQAVKIELGRKIIVSKNGKVFFIGVIFATDVDHEGNLKITAHDYNYYLVKNSDSKVFVKMKASQIVQSICKQYGIEYIHLDDTEYVIPKLILRGKTLYDMITIALTETKKKTGKVFVLRSEGGKLALRERKKQVVQLMVADGHNLFSANYSESMEDMRNSVRLTGKSGEDAKGVTVTNTVNSKRYGLMREKQHESDRTDAQLKPIANALLAELNKIERQFDVEALGDTSIIASKSVQISEKMTGISGGFFVIADSHTFTPNGKHTMSLTVSKTLDVAELEYEPPEENKPATTTTKVSGTSAKASGSSATSSQRQQVVSTAQSYVGRLRYAFGGTNIAGGSGDCSGFVQYVFKKAAGLNLGRDTLSQIGKGTNVAKSAAQPGDVVFFQGTYRSGVSHVGIVTRPGYCISLANSGCKEHSYTSGYWGGHFMQIRRVLP